MIYELLTVVYKSSTHSMWDVKIKNHKKIYFRHKKNGGISATVLVRLWLDYQPTSVFDSPNNFSALVLNLGLVSQGRSLNVNFPLSSSISSAS